MNDSSEAARRQRIAEINQGDTNRIKLEAEYGRVWSTNEMTSEFDAIGFMAPFIVVRRKSDGVKGSLEFSHSPRFYFNFKPE